MALTKAQRRKINQNNAQASTGPRDTSRTRFNALKHGLRAELLFLPNEDPKVIQQRHDTWNDYYQPQNPAEQHLVNECVRATLLSDRVDCFHSAELSQQVRHAGPDWINQQVDRREQLRAQLTDDPAVAVIGLKRFDFGLQYLIGCWERLEQSLIDQGYWDDLERDEAIRLSGFRPESKTLKQNPDAWVIRLFNLCCRPRVKDEAFAWLFDPDRLPDTYRTRYSTEFMPDAETCLGSLKETVGNELAALRAEAEEVRAEVEDLDYTESEARATILRDEKAARLFLRYHAESRTSFHRSYAALVKSIAARDEEPVPVGNLPCTADLPAEDAPSGDGESVSEAASPNEANPAPEASSTDCEATTSVEPDVKKSKGQKGGPKGYDPKEDVGMVLLEMMYQERVAAERAEEVPISIVGAGS